MKLFKSPVHNLSKSLILSAALLSVASCGKPQFKTIGSVESASAPGHFVIPAKVDILLAEDDTGGIAEALSAVSQQMPQFLNQLEAKGWDYHFATIPLTQDRPLDQVLASKSDSNWGSLWTPPYPGAQPGGPGTLPSNIFTMPGSYTDFITSANTHSSSREDAFQNILDAFSNRVPGTEFLRNDALLVVLVLGNGEDTSGITYCPAGNKGVVEPCPGSEAASFSAYVQNLKALKANATQLKLYSHVAAAKHINGGCLGGNSFKGDRYMRMASELGGKSFDICNKTVGSMLTDLTNDLEAAKIAYRTRFLFVAQEPDLTTLKITKIDSSGNPADIPQDASNGWTYVGYQQNLYAIDYPVPMAQASGYAIELHGSAKLLGDETASIEYKPYGAHDTTE